MASLTVRQLDERLKKLLRLRAARSGRSVEDEVRTILREAVRFPEREAGDQVSRPMAEQQNGQTETPREAPPTSISATKNRVLLIIGGGIAAYKSLDLIRRLKERGYLVRCIVTKAAEQFVTPFSVGALAGERAFTNLFDANTEFDVGHIRLARESNLIVVAPATADLMAKLAGGHADDLATAVLLATSAKVLLAPAMNPYMWSNKATQRNFNKLTSDGFLFIGPNEGEMAEANERGLGRMAEPFEIAMAVERLLSAAKTQLLKGKRVLVTSGPTYEPIDPVRYIANRSSGKQGHAIAAAAARAGADVVLISGPVAIPDPADVTTFHVETAREMLKTVELALPVDVAIFTAAVADWRVANVSNQKIKKKSGLGTPALSFTENPDILATITHHKTHRPKLVIGFAAETENLIVHAQDKLNKKACDWIVANDVSPQTGIMGGDSNAVHLIRSGGIESWPPQSKEDVAAKLIKRIADTLNGDTV